MEPVNWRLISHPVNWLVILMMLLIAGILGHLLLIMFDQQPSSSGKSVPEGLVPQAAA